MAVNGRELSSAGGKFDYATNRVRDGECEKLGLIKRENEALKFDYDAYRVPFDELQREKLTRGVPEGQPDDRTMGMLEAELESQRDAAVR